MEPVLTSLRQTYYPMQIRSAQVIDSQWIVYLSMMYCEMPAKLEVWIHNNPADGGRRVRGQVLQYGSLAYSVVDEILNEILTHV